MKRWHTHTSPFYPQVSVSMKVLKSIPHESQGMAVSTYIFCSRAWWAQAREGRGSGVRSWWLAVRVESVNLVTESLWSLAGNSHTFLIGILNQSLIVKMKSLRPAKIECSVQWFMVKPGQKKTGPRLQASFLSAFWSSFYNVMKEWCMQISRISNQRDTFEHLLCAEPRRPHNRVVGKQNWKKKKKRA